MLNILATQGKFLALGIEVELATQAYASLVATPNAGMINELVKFGWGRWLHKIRLKRAVASDTIKRTWDPQSLQLKIQQQSALIQSKAGGKMSLYVIGDSRYVEEEQAIIMPTGITGLDRAMFGGPALGDSTLVVAPESAGKTICMCQIGGHYAYSGFKTLLISTEPHMSPEAIEARIVSRICRVPFNRIMHGVKDFKMLEPQQKAYTALIERLRDNLRIVHWAGNDQTILKDFDRTVETAAEDMGGIQAVAFDWISGKTVGLAGEADMSQARLYYQRGADYIAYASGRFNTTNLLFAQANKLQSLNKAKVDAAMLAECKGMGQNFPNGFGITLLQDLKAGTENGAPLYAAQQFITLFKARKGLPTSIPFKREYEYQNMADFIR